MWAEGEIRVIAERQHGLVSRKQLAELGVTDNDVVRRQAGHRLETVHLGVYYLDSVAATWRTEVLAAVLAAGPDALASHRCAAVLWEFDAIFGHTVEVTVPYVESPEPHGVIVHRTRRANDDTSRDGIRATTPEKTLLDIAPMVPERTLVKAARSAVHDGSTSLERIDLAIGRFGGRGVAGTRKMRRALRYLGEDESGSVAEIDLRYIIFDAPIPEPVQQLRIVRPDGGRAYPDFAWPDRRRIVEIDGFGAHGSPDQLQNDLRRQNQLMELGWEIRRFTASEVRQDPDRVRSEIVRFVDRPVL
ncbi:MAG: type IV toxin-antitoxin system AbiEi family antitoxin domain-containing protein [Acidimicrobiia bacterium]